MTNLKEILKKAYEMWKNEPFIYEKNNNIFTPCTFKDFIENVIYLAKALEYLGLNDNKFMIFSENSLNYLICDTAITGFSGISINIDKNYKYYDLNNAISKCQPHVIFYSHEKENIINEIKSTYNYMNYLEIEKELPKLIKIGKKQIEYENDLFEINGKNPKVCSKIIFSSGSTTLPKPIMLSQENIIAGYESITSRIPLNNKQREYFFLPLNHIFANSSFYYSLMCGKKLFMCENIENIIEELQEVKPNFMLIVPLLCERFYHQTKGDKNLLKKLFGGNINYMLIGGAKVSKELKEKYRNAGIHLKEVYGMTEMANVLAATKITDDDISSTGTLYEKHSYKIIDKDKDGIGELLVKKSDKFLGYYNDPETTNKVLDEDGFYHTGDLGIIINNKFYFKKRKDRLILLPNGEKVNPEELENLIMRKCAVNKATIFLEDDRLKAILYSDHFKNYSKIFEEINSLLPKYKQIKKYEIKSNKGRIK